MQLRGGRVFLYPQHFRYLLVRFFFEHIQVENGSASIGQVGHKGQQLRFGEAAAAFGYTGFVGHVGQLLFVNHQLGDSLLPSQVVYGLRHHHSCHPGGQCTLSFEGEVGEDFDEPVMQYVVRRIHVARIAVAHRKHLFGIKGVKFLAGGISSCPAALYQFYLVFQCQCFLYGRLFASFVS